MFRLVMIMKILAVLGYVSGVIIYEYNFLHLPVFLIPAGLTVLLYSGVHAHYLP